MVYGHAKTQGACTKNFRSKHRNQRATQEKGGHCPGFHTACKRAFGHQKPGKRKENSDSGKGQRMAIAHAGPEKAVRG